MTPLMRRAGGVVALVIVASGCTAPDLATQPESVPTLTTVAPACLEVASYPDLPMHELNASLPVEGLTAEFAQTELRLVKGSGASCDGGLPVPVVDECAVVDMEFGAMTRPVMWRDADAFTEAAFEQGAVGMLYEEVSGGAAGGFYRYQVTAWRYPDADAAEGSIVLEVARRCGAGAPEPTAPWDLQLSQGGDVFFAAFTHENFVFTVEARTGVDSEGEDPGIEGSASGRLTTQALEEIAVWWAARAPGALADDVHLRS